MKVEVGLAEMMISLLNAMFGCSHKRTTFPITPFRRSHMPGETARRGTYVVCLDCGREFDYNWQDMKITGAQLHPATAASMTAINH